MHSTTSRRILTRSIVSLLVLTSASFADPLDGGDRHRFQQRRQLGQWRPGRTNCANQSIAGNIATISANAGQMNEIFVARGGSPGPLNHSAGTASTAGWMDVGTDGGTGTYNLGEFCRHRRHADGFRSGSGSMTVGGQLYVVEPATTTMAARAP